MANYNYQGPTGQPPATQQQQGQQQQQGANKPFSFTDLLGYLVGPVGQLATGVGIGSAFGDGKGLFGGGGGSKNRFEQYPLLDKQQLDLQRLFGQYSKQALTNP